MATSRGWRAPASASATSPLQAAHELDVQLRYRASRDRKSAARKVGAPPHGGKDQAPQPSAAQTQDAHGPAEGVPLIRPQNAAEARPAGPEHKR